MAKELSIEEMDAKISQIEKLLEDNLRRPDFDKLKEEYEELKFMRDLVKRMDDVAERQTKEAPERAKKHFISAVKLMKEGTIEHALTAYEEGLAAARHSGQYHKLISLIINARYSLACAIGDLVLNCPSDAKKRIEALYTKKRSKTHVFPGLRELD